MGRQQTRKLDLEERKFGQLTALRFAYSDKKQAYWRCRCVCGREITVSRNKLLQGRRTACRRACRFPDMTGRVFHGWTVLGRTRRPAGKPGQWWRCRCVCGTEAVRATRQLGGRKSCGCGQRKSDDVAGAGIVFRAYITSAKKRQLPFKLTFDAFCALIQAPCHYCGEPPSRTQRVGTARKTMCNGVDRKNPKRGYTTSNVVTCCAMCNRRKRTTPYAEFMAWIERVWTVRGPISKRRQRTSLSQKASRSGSSQRNP
jgi:hypothetical protein